MFKNNPIVFSILLFALASLIIMAGIYILGNYEIKTKKVDITRREKIIINIKPKNKYNIIQDELRLNNKPCTKSELHVYSCEKSSKGNYFYSIGKYKGEIEIKNEDYSYQIPIDNFDYIIDYHKLFLKGNILQGELVIKEKYGSYKYNNNKNKMPIQLYGKDIDESKIKDGHILFKQNWDEMYNIYYGNRKLYTEYTVENYTYKTSKYYILSKNLNNKDIFSISSDINEPKLDIKDYLKIDNHLIVYGNNNIPNINLIRLSVKEEADLNGFIKFNLIDVHKDSKINLYFGKNKLLSLFFPNYYIQKDLEDGVSTDFYMMSMNQHEKSVELKENLFIKKIEIIFFKDKDNCKIKVTTDNHKPVISNFKCHTKEIGNSGFDINFQLNIESPQSCSKTKNCVLFKVSDIQTGIETNEI